MHGHRQINKMKLRDLLIESKKTTNVSKGGNMAIPKYAQQIQDRILEYEAEAVLLNEKLANAIKNHVKTRARLARRRWLLEIGIPELKNRLELPY